MQCFGSLDELTYMVADATLRLLPSACHQVYHLRLKGKKWVLMLATDGLVDSVRHDVVSECLEQLLDRARSWEQTANLLCAKANAQGDDDVTVICLGPVSTHLSL